MLEPIHDDGYDYNGFRHDGGDGDLSPCYFHFRCARDRGFNQISALLISPAALDARVMLIALTYAPEDASLSEVARRYGIAARVLFRWKQELTTAAPVFVSVQITDAEHSV